MSDLKNGSQYIVRSQRKGTFTARLDSHDETWATLTIISGKARAMLDYNERFAGEEVTVRRSLTAFEECRPKLAEEPRR